MIISDSLHANMPQNFMGLLQIDEGIRHSCHQMCPTPSGPAVVMGTRVFYQTPQSDNTFETSAFSGIVCVEL